MLCSFIISLFHFLEDSLWFNQYFYSEAATEAEIWSCTEQPSVPELGHFGFRKWRLWGGYIFIRCFRGSLSRGAALLWDLLLPIYQRHLHWQGATQIMGMNEWTTPVLASVFRCYTHPSAGAETGGAGLLGVVGDGCSCFSMVNLTSSCLNRTTWIASEPWKSIKKHR